MGRSVVRYERLAVDCCDQSDKLEHAANSFEAGVETSNNAICFIRKSSPCVSLVSVAVAVISSMMVFHHSLSYFNEIAGGPLHGTDHLIHSNVDWGQDLVYLKRWVKDNPSPQSLYVSYFGGCSPSDIGINSRPFPGSSDIAGVSGVQSLPSGIYAISVENLMRATEPGSEDWLLASFLKREPIAHVGWSIRVFQLDRAEVIEHDWNVSE